MKDARVGLKRLLGCEFARNCGVGAQAIVKAGAVGQRNQGKDVAALEIHPLLPQRIRAIT